MNDDSLPIEFYSIYRPKISYSKRFKILRVSTWWLFTHFYWGLWKIIIIVTYRSESFVICEEKEEDKKSMPKGILKLQSCIWFKKTFQTIKFNQWSMRFWGRRKILHRHVLDKKFLNVFNFLRIFSNFSYSYSKNIFCTFSNNSNPSF
jgi:hypothetical protein